MVSTPQETGCLPGTLRPPRHCHTELHPPHGRSARRPGQFCPGQKDEAGCGFPVPGARGAPKPLSRPLPHCVSCGGNRPLLSPLSFLQPQFTCQ